MGPVYWPSVKVHYEIGSNGLSVLEVRTRFYGGRVI